MKRMHLAIIFAPLLFTACNTRVQLPVSNQTPVQQNSVSRLSNAQTPSAYQGFKSMDQNNDGFVTLEEMISVKLEPGNPLYNATPAEKMAYAKQHMGYIDRDRDGKASLHEYMSSSFGPGPANL